MGGTRTILAAGDFVAAVFAKDKSKVLLGICGAGFNDDVNQTEAVLNQYFLLKHGFKKGIDIQDCPLIYGGDQCIYLPDGKEIPLEYDRSVDIIYTLHQEPTKAELRDILIIWLSPRIGSKTLLDPVTIQRRSKEAVTPKIITTEPVVVIT